MPLLDPRKQERLHLEQLAAFRSLRLEHGLFGVERRGNPKKFPSASEMNFGLVVVSPSPRRLRHLEMSFSAVGPDLETKRQVSARPVELTPLHGGLGVMKMMVRPNLPADDQPRDAEYPQHCERDEDGPNACRPISCLPWHAIAHVAAPAELRM